MQMITYETTWRALMCSAMSLEMEGLVWMVYGFYNKGFYGILNNPSLTQWNCDKALLRTLAHRTIFATSTMWAPRPELPIYCDKNALMNTTVFKADYLARAAALSTNEMVAKGGRDYRVNAPRDCGAQAADGVCLFAQVLSSLMGTHPTGKATYSGSTYTLTQIQARGAAVYEDFNKLLQSASFNGVSGSPFTFACSNMPSNGECDATCRNDLGCTGDANGATIVFQFDKDGTEGVSDGLAADSEFPRIMIYDRGLELSGGGALAYDWNTPIIFPYGGYWGGASASAPTIAGSIIASQATCKEGYHVVNGTSYCVPDDMFVSCASGTVLIGEFCQSCPVKKYYDSLLGACVTCALGTFQNETGQTSCKKCAKGYYQNISAGATECTPCGLGTFADNTMTENCVRCPKGTFAGSLGSESCARCDIGTYSAALGSQACTACPGALSTQGPGAISVADCMCPREFYESDSATNTCAACPDGMTCAFGSKYSAFASGGVAPEVLKGYYTRVDSPMTVFQCAVEDDCPGGAPATCKGLRKSLLCSECPDDYFGKDCKKCDGSSALPFALVCVGLFIALCILYKLIDMENRVTQPKSHLLIILLFGQSILAVQQFGVMSTISVEWADPLKSVIGLANLLNFNVEILNLPCVAGALSPQSSLIGKCGCIVLVIVVMSLIHLFFVAAKYGPGQLMAKSSTLIGAVGTLFLIFLTSIVNAAIAPFECLKHPSGERTVRRYPMVLCTSSSEYEGMLAIGAIFLVIPLAYVAICCFIVKGLPSAMRRGDMLFLKKFNFLFQRFRAETYWYILWYIVRNLFIALAPAVPSVMLQVLIINGFMVVSVSLVSHYMPWRVNIANYGDIFVQLMMNMIIAFVGFFSSDGNEDMNMVATIGVVFICLVILALIACVAKACYDTLANRNKKPWKYFLCHHKGGAGAFARLLKMHIQETADPSKRVRAWLDCDDLTNLEMLFDYVGTQSANMVAIMSKELFLRPWCMGEMVTAHANKVNMLPVKFPDFQELTGEFIEQYNTHVDVACLTPHGISLEMVQNMLGYVSQSVAPSAVVLPDVLTLPVIDSLTKLLESGSVDRKVVTASKPKVVDDAKVRIITDHSNWESVCAAHVLIKYIRKETNDVSILPVLVENGEDLPSSTACAIFVMSNGAFMQADFVKLMLAAEKMGVRYIPIIAEDAFRFPRADMLKEIEAAAPTIFKPYGIKDAPEHISATVAALFKEIAVVFSPQDYSSNDGLLKVKAQAIVARVKGGSLRKLTAEDNRTAKEAREAREAREAKEARNGATDDGGYAGIV